MFQTLRYKLCQQLAWQLTQLAYWPIVIDKIYNLDLDLSPKGDLHVYPIFQSIW